MQHFTVRRRSDTLRPDADEFVHSKGRGLKLEVSNDQGRETAGELFLLSPCADYRAVRTVICGHSHSYAISHGLVFNSLRPGETPAMDAARRLGLAGLRGGPMDDSYMAAMDKIAETKNVAVIWDGNQPVRHFLLSSGRSFDLVPKGYPQSKVLAGAQLVPEEAIRAQFEPSLVPLERFLERHKARRRTQRYVLGLHPPSRDDAEIRRRLAKEDFFAQRAEEMGLDIDRVEITPAPVRHKLWYVLQQQLMEVAARHEAQFIAAPPSAFDSDGYLKPELGGNDVSHASFAFGSLMVEHIAANLER